MARWSLRLGAFVVLSLSALILVNSIPYFSFRTNFAFLQDKGALLESAPWRLAFYGHLLGSLICLSVAPFLFWEGLRRRRPGLHRALGRLYGGAVLGWAAPTGLYLSLYARGGLPGRSGFLILGLLWWGATALGVRSILAGRLDAHRRWMLRSYAVALSAVSFRVFYVALFAAGVPDEAAYPISLWLSLGASLASGEIAARRTLLKGASRENHPRALPARPGDARARLVRDPRPAEAGPAA